MKRGLIVAVALTFSLQSRAETLELSELDAEIELIEAKQELDKWTTQREALDVVISYKTAHLQRIEKLFNSGYAHEIELLRAQTELKSAQYDKDIQLHRQNQFTAMVEIARIRLASRQGQTYDPNSLYTYFRDAEAQRCLALGREVQKKIEEAKYWESYRAVQQFRVEKNYISQQQYEQDLADIANFKAGQEFTQLQYARCQ